MNFFRIPFLYNFFLIHRFKYQIVLIFRDGLATLTAPERFSAREAVLQIIFDAIIQHEKTAAGELEDLIPAIDWITAIYYLEFIKYSKKIQESYEKCKEILRLKLKFE